MAGLKTNTLSPVNAANSVVIDATWVLPGSGAHLAEGYLPGTRLFDVAALKTATPLGRRFPSADNIVSQANALGIEKEQPLLIYDRHGLFSAPFVQWCFQSVGHENVELIDGGLPYLISQGHETVATPLTPKPKDNYAVSAPLCKGVVMAEVIKALSTNIQIVDARSAGRFNGTQAEPRAGMRSGHMPGAINLPLGMLLTDEKRIRNDSTNVISRAGIELDKPIITTCGSGVTASALRYIFEKFGATDVSVYLGSWAEWGGSNAPIEV